MSNTQQPATKMMKVQTTIRNRVGDGTKPLMFLMPGRPARLATPNRKPINPGESTGLKPIKVAGLDSPVA